MYVTVVLWSIAVLLARWNVRVRTGYMSLSIAHPFEMVFEGSGSDWTLIEKLK